MFGKSLKAWQELLRCVALLVTWASCDPRNGEAGSETAQVPLPPGAVAMVGGATITGDDVDGVARAHGIDRARALDLVVHDTLLARGAEARSLAMAPEVAGAIRGALGRQVLKDALAKARSEPLTDAEVAEASKRKWLEIDRPEGVRTIHALVRFTPRDPAAKRQRGSEIAEAIRAAIVPMATRTQEYELPGVPSEPWPSVQDPTDPLAVAFRKAASAVPHDGAEVTIEALPAVASDGRVLLPGQPPAFDSVFVAAATSLRARGAMSPVTLTVFGAHVILLLERTPPIVLSAAARRNRLRNDIENERARAAVKRLLASPTPRSSIAPDAAGLLDLLANDQ